VFERICLEEEENQNQTSPLGKAAADRLTDEVPEDNT